MTLNNASDILSGGTITFNGKTVIIPRNLLVNLPSVTAVSWTEMFTVDGKPNLPLWPTVNWEVSVSSCSRSDYAAIQLTFDLDSDRCLPTSLVVNTWQESSIFSKK
jgi:hypothetical protein